MDTVRARFMTLQPHLARVCNIFVFCTVVASGLGKHHRMFGMFASQTVTSLRIADRFLDCNRNTKACIAESQ